MSATTRPRPSRLTADGRRARFAAPYVALPWRVFAGIGADGFASRGVTVHRGRADVTSTFQELLEAAGRR